MHEVAVVGDDSVVEHERADTAPVAERAPLFERRAGRFPFVGELDVEGELSLRRGIAAVEYLRHDLVAEVEAVAGDSRLIRRVDQQAHELRRARRLAGRLSQLRDRVQLADRRLLVDLARTSDPGVEQRRGAQPSTRHASCWARCAARCR